MDIGRLKQRIDNLRQPIITWLDFYKIKNLEEKTDQELTTMLINKITNYREYGYTQNREFEELLQVPLTNENEERNKINWNIIVDIYKIHMKETIERLGKTFEDLGYRQQWQALSNQAIIICNKNITNSSYIIGVFKIIEINVDQVMAKKHKKNFSKN